MSGVEVKTEIAAPCSTVYQQLMDFASYPSWNPMIVQIDGTPNVGSKIEAHVKIGSRSPNTFKPTIVKNEMDKELRWVGALFFEFLFRGEHYFILEETEKGCMFVHGEKWSGIAEPLIMRMLGADTELSFKAFNDALKKRVEEGRRI